MKAITKDIKELTEGRYYFILTKRTGKTLLIEVKTLEFRLVRGAKPKSLKVIETGQNVVNRKAGVRCYGKNIRLTESLELSCN